MEYSSPSEISIVLTRIRNPRLEALASATSSSPSSAAPPMQPSGRRRRWYTLEERKRALGAVANGISVGQYSRESGVPSGTIYAWVREHKASQSVPAADEASEEIEIEARTDRPAPLARPLCRRGRTLTRVVELCLYSFLLDCQSHGGLPHNDVLRAERDRVAQLFQTSPEALEAIAAKLPPDFIPSFDLRMYYVPALSRSITNVPERRINVAAFPSILADVLVEWSVAPWQLYAAYPTFVRYGPGPRRTRGSSEPLASGSNDPGYFGVLLAMNCDGSHVLEPMFVGNESHQRTRSDELLPEEEALDFAPGDCGVVTQARFQEWFRDSFQPAVRRHQSDDGRPEGALLIVDRRFMPSWDPFRRVEERFRLVYLPRQGQPERHPLLQGVVRAFKRRLMRGRVDEALQGLRAPPLGGPRERAQLRVTAEWLSMRPRRDDPNWILSLESPVSEALSFQSPDPPSRWIVENLEDEGQSCFGPIEQRQMPLGRYYIRTGDSDDGMDEDD